MPAFGIRWAGIRLSHRAKAGRNCECISRGARGEYFASGAVFVMALMFAIAGTAYAAEVTIAPDRMTEVNGKRTFVLGLYENPKEDAILDEVAAAGFNIVHASEAQAGLDRLHQRGLFAWVNAGGRIDLGKDGAGSDAPLRAMVDACGAHPALLAWEIPDEALWCCWLDAYAQPLPLVQRYDAFRSIAAERSAGLIAGYNALKKMDAKHPVWINHAALNSIQDLATFNKAADIVGCDEYPVLPYPTPLFDVSRRMLGMMGTITERMQAAAPGKPVWMVLQGTGWVDFDGMFGPKDPNGQRPAFAESRFMAYDVIARGARGILYWGTSYLQKDAGLWKDLMKVVRELADLQPVLSAPDADIVPAITAPALVFVGSQAVQALGKNVDGEVWWIVVNEYPMRVGYTLGNLATLNGKAYTEVGSGARVSVAGGAIRRDIAGYGVDILKPCAP